MLELYFMIGLFLFLLSVIDIGVFDIKKGGIPAPLSTILLISALLISGGMSNMIFGALMGLILFELYLCYSISDIKAFAIASALMPTPLHIIIMAFLFAFISSLYKLMIRKKQKQDIREIPNIPAIMISYITILSFMVFL